MKTGTFITLEGGEGAGKSTLARALAGRASEHGIDVVLTREPGGTKGAEAVRHVLLSGDARKFGPFGEAVLFAAARQDHLREVVRPALARGATVICDRFIDSTRAYQGMLGGVDEGVLDALERLSVGPTRPGLTLVLDIDQKKAARRRGMRAGQGDRFENEDDRFHKRVRQAFLAIAGREPERCRVLDASQDAETLASEAWAIVEPFISAGRAASAA